MSRDNLSFLSNVFGLAFIFFMGVVLEGHAQDPTPIILMFLCGIVAAGFHDEYRKEGADQFPYPPEPKPAPPKPEIDKIEK